MAGLYYDRDRRDYLGAKERLGNLEYETTAICPVCADVDCLEHAEDPETVKSERMAMRTAFVVTTARQALEAFDASDLEVPKRLRAAMMDLSDALARYDGTPF